MHRYRWKSLCDFNFKLVPHFENEITFKKDPLLSEECEFTFTEAGPPQCLSSLKMICIFSWMQIVEHSPLGGILMF